MIHKFQLQIEIRISEDIAVSYVCSSIMRSPADIFHSEREDVNHNDVTHASAKYWTVNLSLEKIITLKSTTKA